MYVCECVRVCAGAPGEQAAGGGAVRGGEPGVARRGGRGRAAGAAGGPGRAARAEAAAVAARRSALARQVNTTHNRSPHFTQITLRVPSQKLKSLIFEVFKKMHRKKQFLI